MFIYYLDRRKLIKAGLTILFLLIVLVFLAVFYQNKSKGVSQQDVSIPLEKVSTDQKVIALTINVDWGEEYLPRILEILDQNDAKATFFVTGRWTGKNPELLKEIASRGHEIENHGYSHPHPDRLTIAKNKEELLKTEKVIFDTLGKKTVFYAPPYGERGRNGLLAAQELGYTSVLWTFDTIDWRPDSTPQLIAQRVLDPKMRNGIKPERKGSIVLMHPKENTVKALPVILNRLQQEGYQAITLEKLITLRLSGNTTP